MDRPVTSKSRGICRYYTTQRGCFAGDSCRFLHGADEKLTPFDKAKVCRYYARGYCTRGDRCWFRHVLPKVAPEDERIQFNAETCCICLEKPDTYGLLTDCSHVFCLECIRQWRAPGGKSPDAVSSGTIKCCPLCRTPSRFVTPSAHFFPSGSLRKKETIDAYKASMARVACKYFEETARTGKPCCPFGLDCFYQHINSDGTPHVFHHGAKHSMHIYKRHTLRGASFPVARFDDPVQFLQHIFENPITNLHATLDVIRASLPALIEGLASSNESGNHGSGGDENPEGYVNPFDLLEDNLLMHDETETLVPAAAEENSPQFAPVESSTEYGPTSMQVPLFSETQSTSQSQSTRLSSRFSTVMGNHSRQPFIIDISDEEEEEEEESAQSMSDNSIELSDSSPLPPTPRPRSSPEHPTNAVQSLGNLRVDRSLGPPQLEHDVDPPFMTDGRGRVVWSSTRNASGRGTATEGRGPRHSRTGSSARTTCPPPNSALLAPNALGHAWGGQDAPAIDGKASGGEQNGGAA